MWFVLDENQAKCVGVGQPNIKRKLDNVEREKMTDGGGDYRKVWAVSRVGLGWGGSQAASAGRHTVCRHTQPHMVCRTHNPVTLMTLVTHLHIGENASVLAWSHNI